MRVARFVLSLTLAWAGAAKLASTEEFARSSRSLLPSRLAFAVPLGARILPWVEIATAALLLTGAGAIPALVIASVLFSGFLVVVVRARRLGLDSSCSCFGAGRDEPVDALTVARTALLWATAVGTTVAALLDDRPQLPLFRSGAGVLPTLIAGSVIVTAAAVGGAALRLLTTVEAEIDSRGFPDEAPEGHGA